MTPLQIKRLEFLQNLLQIEQNLAEAISKDIQDIQNGTPAFQNLALGNEEWKTFVGEDTKKFYQELVDALEEATSSDEGFESASRKMVLWSRA